MSELHDRFVETYASMENARTTRNFWTLLSLGGAAVGVLVGVVSGDHVIGGLIAYGSALGAGEMALDANLAVSSTRRSLNSMQRYIQPVDQGEVTESALPVQSAEASPAL